MVASICMTRAHSSSTEAMLRPPTLHHSAQHSLFSFLSHRPEGLASAELREGPDGSIQVVTTEYLHAGDEVFLSYGAASTGDFALWYDEYCQKIRTSDLVRSILNAGCGSYFRSTACTAS